MILAIRLIVVLSLVLPIGAIAASRQPLTSYTRQLIELLNLFKKLDEAAATRMAENERYLMAKAMLRLSSAFYRLRNDKEELVRQIERGRRHGDRADVAHAVFALRSTVRCLSAQLNDKGARIGALVGFDGPAVEEQLREGLQGKILTLDDLLEDLGLSPRTPNLDEAIVNDARAAQKAADALYRRTAEFAHVLDPSVVAPQHFERCVYPDEDPMHPDEPQ